MERGGADEYLDLKVLAQDDPGWHPVELSDSESFEPHCYF